MATIYYYYIAIRRFLQVKRRQGERNFTDNQNKIGYFFAETAKGCDMDTLLNEEAASPLEKYCARPINRMGHSPRAVSNQRKGSRFSARPLKQPRGFEPGTSCF